MAKGGRKSDNHSTPNERGQRGNTRGKERQVRKRVHRDQQTRNREAKADVAAQKAELKRLLEQERKGRAAGAEFGPIAKLVEGSETPVEVTMNGRPLQPRVRREPPSWRVITARLPYEGDGKDKDAIRWARSIVRQGYTIEHAVSLTGVGTKWLDDLPLDTEDGRGLPL